MSQPPSDFATALQRMHQGAGHDDEAAQDLAAIVFQKNRENALRFLRTPYARRIVFVPQCLRSTSACQAEQRDGEYLCKNCGACKIPHIARRASELGYITTRILKGGSALPRLIRETSPQAVLGVSCVMEGVIGILLCERVGVPAFCVPLLRTGCSDTDVDLKDVMAALEAVLP